ncbi:MAG: type II secretion system protein [Patescibacteria group bacterium]|nr:type II secretion system protein [Patescibacteria group bacterium]
MKFKNQTGFTLIELLVVIVIVGILATLTTVALSTARVKARDAKRISDIKQMQTALELYYNEENTYPPTSALDVGKALVGAQSGKTFMGKIPAGPNTGETYTYAQINGGTSYTLGYTLEKPVNEFAAGAAIALPGSINNQCIPNCSDKYCGDSDGCSGKCTAVPSLLTGSLTCDSSTYQLRCGTTVIANYAKINQCSVDTATCSGATCAGAQVCVSNICQDPCTVDADCGFCKKCVAGGCTNQTASEDLKNECVEPTANDASNGCLTGKCSGTGSTCGVYSDTNRNNCPANYNCYGSTIGSGGSCCTLATCGGATGLCSGQTTCGITCNTACTSCCKGNNYCGTIVNNSCYLNYNNGTCYASGTIWSWMTTGGPPVSAVTLCQNNFPTSNCTMGSGGCEGSCNFAGTGKQCMQCSCSGGLCGTSCQ